jgi:hypothetical protein
MRRVTPSWFPAGAFTVYHLKIEKSTTLAVGGSWCRLQPENVARAMQLGV